LPADVAQPLLAPLLESAAPAARLAAAGVVVEVGPDAAETNRARLEKVLSEPDADPISSDRLPAKTKLANTLDPESLARVEREVDAWLAEAAARHFGPDDTAMSAARRRARRVGRLRLEAEPLLE